MKLVLLDYDFTSLADIDTFSSLIWTERYSEYGDFELTFNSMTPLIAMLSRGRYLWLEESQQQMVIEDIQIHTDAEIGNQAIIKGRSLESLLTRRVVWVQTLVSGSLQNGIKKLLDENVITPLDPNRAIPNLFFETSTNPEILELTMDAQYTGDNIYSVITDLCFSNNIGFRLNLDNDNNFIFKLYSGVDRSYNQIENPYVVFSPEFENLVNSDYRETDADMKTIALVGGEGEGTERTYIAVAFPDQAGTGLDRREYFTDARDITRDLDEGQQGIDAYISQLANRGSETLLEHRLIRTFEGEIDATKMYVYGKDYSIGDILVSANEYGHMSNSRVTEVIYSQDESGVRIYPTFSTPYN